MRVFALAGLVLVLVVVLSATFGDPCDAYADVTGRPHIDVDGHCVMALPYHMENAR